MKYPKLGEKVRVKNETGLHTITNRIRQAVVLDDGRIFGLDQIITRHQKTIKVYVIQVHYGAGWEDVTQEETLSEARDRRREYRDNQNYPVRLITRREPNDLYQEKE